MEQYYSIRHVTRYRYSSPIRESVMQLYMQPRSESGQWLRSFQIVTQPRAQLFAYTDHLGNAVYHFNIPQEHSMLIVDMTATVETGARSEPPICVASGEWDQLLADQRAGKEYDMLMQSAMTQPSALLEKFIADHELSYAAVRGRFDPMAALRHLNSTLYKALDYDREVTDVDSVMDVALEKRKGVCQDFAHVMISIARGWGVPCRYVSGYVFSDRSSRDRSVPDSTHAWVEAHIPSVGWVGFDPTNNHITADRHIAVAVGRDYTDVPPSKGVYTGDAQGELAVAVKVTPTRAPDRHEDFLRIVRPMRPDRSAPRDELEHMRDAQHQQQQQQ